MGTRNGRRHDAADETVADWRSEAKKVMIRAFDFTAKEDETYRYRVRIVVYNPNLGREDVDTSKAVDTKAEELRGPWSQATDPVSMPPDVMPYASATSPPSAVGDMKVRFQVIRFNPVDGVTVPHRFEASPGEMIGEPAVGRSPGFGRDRKEVQDDRLQQSSDRPRCLLQQENRWVSAAPCRIRRSAHHQAVACLGSPP